MKCTFLSTYTVDRETAGLFHLSVDARQIKIIQECVFSYDNLEQDARDDEKIVTVCIDDVVRKVDKHLL